MEVEAGFRELSVALLAEGVDRNIHFAGHCRGAVVALLAEGVDRNIDAAIKEMDEVGRPPRGGRG